MGRLLDRLDGPFGHPDAFDSWNLCRDCFAGDVDCYRCRLWDLDFPDVPHTAKAFQAADRG